MDIVIIGGGITGLAAAYYTVEKAAAAGQTVQVALLEASNRWGGKIVTDRIEGFGDAPFIVEGGPDTFLASKPWGVALCKALGLSHRLHGTNPAQKNTYVLHRDRLEKLPDGLAMMVPASVRPMLETRLLTWPQKARMGVDLLLPVKPENGDESLGSFVSRRLGRAAYENLIEPLMSGIYAGDGNRLSLQSTFPFLRDLEVQHGSLVRGAMAMKQKMAARANGSGNGNGHKPALTGTRSAFLTPTTGLAEIIEALVAHLTQRGVDLRLNAPVQQLDHRPDSAQPWRVTLEGETLSADGLILAAPAYTAGELLANLDPQLAADLQAIEYISTATISLAYRASDLPRPLDGYGYVIPRRLGRRALACTWTSTKFPHRTPEGSVLLRVFAGRAGQEIPWDEPGLTELAREELRQTMGITAEPLFVRVFRWERAMPQYNLGHPQRLQRIDAAVRRLPGLALAGAGYRGIGIPDCIHSGEQAAQAILEI